MAFHEGDHVFLKVHPINGITQIKKSKKLWSRYYGAYLIMQWIGNVAYAVGLPLELASMHNIFHIS